MFRSIADLPFKHPIACTNYQLHTHPNCTPIVLIIMLVLSLYVLFHSGSLTQAQMILTNEGEPFNP